MIDCGHVTKVTVERDLLGCEQLVRWDGWAWSNLVHISASHMLVMSLHPPPKRLP